MEGSGEGVAAVLRGLKDAGLVLTMVSRRVCRQDPPRLAVRRSSSTLPLKYIQRRNARVTATKKLSAPRMNSSMQTSTEPTAKVDSGAQAYDDRYISSYQIAHCKMEPTSPPGYSPEFPPQKANPCRDGHFSVGTYGCEKILPTSIRSDTVRNHSKWPDRGFFGLRGNSCQTDAFAYSLRRYSQSHPCRTKSVDLIDRLVRYRQGKNVISSKMSKSARTIPKKLTDIKEDRKARRTARVQTYTRARPDIERESLETSDTIAPQAFRGWKYKKSNGTLTYDYLKPTSELYRKRRDRVADVRYMDNVSQFMRNPINSLYFNEPKVCPKLLSRYNEHIRRNHATEQSSNTNPNGKTQATRQVGCHWPSQREATMQTGGINDKSCSTAPHDSTIKNNQTSQDALTASRNRDSGFVDDTEHPELKMQFWLDELPVYPNETPEQKLTREREMKKLANTLKGIPHDEYFDDNARNEIINCLNTIPIWLPASEPERKKFKELLAQNLLQKSKNTSSGSNNTLVQIVENWVGQIPLNGNNITKKHLVEDIVNQLKPIVENMPSNKKDGVQVLEHKIDEIFKEIRTRDMKDEEVDGLVDSLVDSLMNLSKISVGQTDSFREIQTKVNEWIRDDLNNNSLLKQNKMPIEDLCGKIYGLKIIGNGNNTVRTDMGREINAFLRDVTTFKTASTIENMTEKLLKSILGNPPGDQDKTTAEKEKNIIQQVILREVDEFLNAASTRMPLGQLDVLKEEVTQMLVNQGDQIVTARFEDTTSEDEADRMIDKLLERVKGIYLGSRAMNNLIVNTILTNVPNLVSYTNIMNNIHMKFANSEKSINFNHANPNVSRLVRQFVYYFDSDKNNAKDLIMQRIAKKILSANRPLSKSESTNEGHNTVDLDLSLTGNNENVPENSGNSTINNQYTINNETFRNPLNERKLSNGRQDNVPTSLSPTQNRPLRGFHNSRASNTGRTDKSEIGRSAVVDIDSRREKTDLKNENTKKNDNKVKPFREDDTRLLHKGFDKNGSIDLSLELTNILEHLINRDISIDQTKIDILNLLDNNHSLNKTTYTDFERGIGVIDNEDKSNRAKEVCGINNKDPSKSNKRNATNNTGGSARRASKCAMVDADCSDSALNKLSNNVGTQARRCDKDSGKPKVITRHYRVLDYKQKISHVVTEIFENIPKDFFQNKRTSIMMLLIDIISSDISAETIEVINKILTLLTNETKLPKELVHYICNEIVDRIDRDILCINNPIYASSSDPEWTRIRDNDNACKTESKHNTELTKENKYQSHNISSSTTNIAQRRKFESQIQTSHHEVQTMSKSNFQSLRKWNERAKLPLAHLDKDVRNGHSNKPKTNHPNDSLSSYEIPLLVYSKKCDYKGKMINELVKDVIEKQLFPMSDVLGNPQIYDRSSFTQDFTTEVVLSSHSIKGASKTESFTDVPPLSESSRKSLETDKGKGMLGKVESLYDYIKMWANKLPFDESILNKEDINSLKQDFTSKMLKKINDVAANPDIFNDSSLYEDVIKDEIDSLTNEIQEFLDGDEYKLKKMKEELVDFIIEERSKTLNNLAGKAYKQQLRDAVAETIPSELDVTLKEDEISFNVLKDTLADAFINLNYSKNNEPLRNKAKKKIAKEITKFCNDYLNRHPDIPLSETELNKELYSNLNNVPLPSNESMKSEVELIRIKEVIKDWMKDLPLVDLSASEQYQQIRKTSILAKTLLDLENIKNENNYALVQTDMKNEIVKWLKKMPLQLEKTSNLDSIAQDLVVVLKNTESDRKFRPSSRLSADITNSPCKDIYSACPRLPCALSIEDCKHLERIRDRTCNWKSRKARRICTDAGVGSCMDNGSQTDGKAFGCIKSVPSVCPRGFQGSAHIRRTPSCWSPKPSRTRVNRIPSGEIRKCCDRYAKRNRICTPRESCAEIQIKVKDCSWDEPECSATTRIPCKNTPQEPCSFYRNPRRLQQSSQRCGYQKKHIRPPQISTRQNFDLQPQRYRQCKVRDAHLDSYVFRSLRLLRSTESKFSSVRFPVEDFLETSCARESNMTSGEESAPTHGRQAKRRDRADCGWYDMDLSGSKTKARTNDRDCGHFSRKPVKNIPKSFAAQCPYPSYLYFRQ